IAKPPPQLGQTFSSTLVTQSMQNVHSKLQIIASVDSAGRGRLQCSHVGLSSSIGCSQLGDQFGAQSPTRRAISTSLDPRPPPCDSMSIRYSLSLAIVIVLFDCIFTPWISHSSVKLYASPSFDSGDVLQPVFATSSFCFFMLAEGSVH